MSDVQPSTFTQAVGPIREDDLRCPYCGAMNRVGVTYIELSIHGLAICIVCGKSHIPKEPE